MSENEKLLFVDNINVFSLVPLLRNARRFTKVISFNPPNPFFSWLIRQFGRVGFFQEGIHPVEYNFSEIKDSNGRLVYIQTLEEILELLLLIKKKALTKDPLLQAAVRILRNPKIILHFEGIYRTSVRVACLQIVMVQWYRKLKPDIFLDGCLLLTQKEKCMPFIIDYGKRKGVIVQPYSPMKLNLRLGRLYGLTTAMIEKGLHQLESLIRNRFWRAEGLPDQSPKKLGIPQASSELEPKIGVAYSYRKITMNPDQRSELFWLEESGIRLNQIVLFGHLNPEDVDGPSIQYLMENGLRVFGNGAYSTPFYPSARAVLIFARIMGRLAAASLGFLVKGHLASLFYFKELVFLFARYAYWIEFFQTNNIRVRVSADSVGSVDQTLALEAVGALNAGYQYSSGVLNSPLAAWTAGENVKFLFSEIFVKKWQALEAPVDQYVFTGFIDDYFIDTLKKTRPPKVWREKLVSAGAQFIICFFDENSLDRWDHFATNQAATEDYRYLLEWLLTDESLGMIFKPKKWPTLFERIRNIRPLIVKAQETGRCVFMGSDARVGSVFPAEAAYNADLCIAKLVGTAAALEATLMGVDTFLLDRENLQTREFVVWGDGHFLYHDWEELKVGVEAYREGYGREKLRLGWTQALTELDEFQDGRAHLRIGRFLQWILEAYSLRMNRSEAIRYACQRLDQESLRALHPKTKSQLMDENPYEPGQKNDRC